MTLEQYLERRKMTMQEFSRLTGLSTPFISQLKTGQRNPSRATMKIIADATKGKVNANDFMENDDG